MGSTVHTVSMGAEAKRGIAKRVVTLAILLAILIGAAFIVAFSAQNPSRRMMPTASLPAPSGPAASAEHVVDGRALQASPSELTLRTSDGRSLRLRLDHNTDVLLDGEKAFRDELRQGDEVRAAYQGAAKEPTAIRVEAVSPGKRR